MRKFLLLLLTFWTFADEPEIFQAIQAISKKNAKKKMRYWLKNVWEKSSDKNTRWIFSLVRRHFFQGLSFLFFLAFLIKIFSFIFYIFFCVHNICRKKKKEKKKARAEENERKNNFFFLFFKWVHGKRSDGWRWWNVKRREEEVTEWSECLIKGRSSPYFFFV